MSNVSKYRVDIFDNVGQHHKINFNDYELAKGHAEGVKRDMPDSKVFILESVVDLKYDVLEEIDSGDDNLSINRKIENASERISKQEPVETKEISR